MLYSSAVHYHDNDPITERSALANGPSRPFHISCQYRDPIYRKVRRYVVRTADACLGSLVFGGYPSSTTAGLGDIRHLQAESPAYARMASPDMSLPDERNLWGSMPIPFLQNSPKAREEKSKMRLKVDIGCLLSQSLARPLAIKSALHGVRPSARHVLRASTCDGSAYGKTAMKKNKILRHRVIGKPHPYLGAIVYLLGWQFTIGHIARHQTMARTRRYLRLGFTTETPVWPFRSTYPSYLKSSA
ncbi:hypothetical protein F5Y17DRAFT_407620 [Xylariaceae sp. FL0594]|nr:hypothetical protein F5Y17DRAFT_407620 [Xylariaceae sp. FL0594]